MDTTETMFDPMDGEELYQIETMADGARNTGYKSTYNAIAEIVDNSIESSAHNVFIIGKQDLVMNQQCIREFAFLDDGTGMTDEVLAKCLKIGFTTRSQRQGMGRFGVGLPQASYFVSPRVEVYTWQNGIDNCKCVYVDLDLVSAGDQTRIVGPYDAQIPEEYQSFINFVTADKTFNFSQHGTLVRWSKCDRVDHKKWNTCKRNISEDLGRKYRWMINEGTINIATVEMNDLETFEVILPNDPLFLMQKTQFCVRNSCGDQDPSCQKYDEALGYTESLFEPYVTEENQTGIVEHLVYYFDKNGQKNWSTVQIRFSIVKERFYDKAYVAVDPGNHQYGKCAKKNMGISIVRQGREIDFGDFGYYDDAVKPNHRWWGCEISFTSELDEAFGIANNKQQVTLKRIDDDDLPDFDGNEPMWIQLRSIVSGTINKMFRINSERRSGTRSASNGITATTATSETVKAAEAENPDIMVPNIEQPQLTPEIKDQIEKELKEEGFTEVTEEQIVQYLGSNTRVKYVNYGPRSAFVDFQDDLGVLKIIVNKDHQFYQEFVQEAYQDEKMQVTFELFLASLVKTVYQLKNTYPAAMDRLVDEINTKLKIYINTRN